MVIAEERERLLELPRQALARARRDPSTWAEFAFRPESARNGAARYGLVLALQYDRRAADLALLRFVLRQQIAWCRERTLGYFPTILFQAGLLVAEHRRVEDVWLHWEAKELSFDTALGYRDHLLLTPGVTTVRDAVARASEPARDRLLDHLTRSRWTDTDVDVWLAEQRLSFPEDPAAEDLKRWSHHASALGDPEASRRFLIAWADGEPRTVDTLNTVQFHLAEQGFFTEAIAAQREVVTLAEPDDRSFRLCVLAELQRKAADPEGAWHSLQTAAAELPAGRAHTLPGLWCQVARECFLIAPLVPAERTRAAFDLGEEVLRGGPAWWMNGAADAALAAAERLGDVGLVARAREMRRIADEQRATG